MFGNNSNLTDEKCFEIMFNSVNGEEFADNTYRIRGRNIEYAAEKCLDAYREELKKEEKKLNEMSQYIEEEYTNDNGEKVNRLVPNEKWSDQELKVIEAKSKMEARKSQLIFDFNKELHNRYERVILL